MTKDCTYFDVQAEWASLVMQGFAEAGVVHVIVSPGSRSTPFVLAALRCPLLQIHSVIDERSAGFFGLALAKSSGFPVLLLCTSGSALAHYGPALSEANQSCTPLLILSADRPLELQGASAPQTMDHIKFFAAATRGFVDLGIADARPAALAGVQRHIAQAVALSRYPTPGPVHVNIRARKPLEPQCVTLDHELELAKTIRAAKDRGIPRVVLPKARAAMNDLVMFASQCRERTRGLIACGPAPMANAALRESLYRLSQLTGYPIVADATSQLRFGLPPSFEEQNVTLLDAFPALLRSPSFRKTFSAEIILSIGSPPSCAAWEAYSNELPDAHHIVFSSYQWCDPYNSATHMVVGDCAENIAALSALLEQGDPFLHEHTWKSELAAHNERAWQVVETSLPTSDELCEPQAIVQAVTSIPNSTTNNVHLAIGNSLPLRLVDLYCRADERTISVWSQRGVNGIDGHLASAAGLAALGRPTMLLIGDVSFAHDLGSLTCLQNTRVPVVIVLMNNAGGQIFSCLPIGKDPRCTAALPYFTTPPRCSFSDAARTFDLPYYKAETSQALASALEQAWGHAGATIVEVLVSGAQTVALLDELTERMELLCR